MISEPKKTHRGQERKITTNKETETTDQRGSSGIERDSIETTIGRDKLIGVDKEEDKDNMQIEANANREHPSKEKPENP